jgi:hypothetical protein
MEVWRSSISHAQNSGSGSLSSITALSNVWKRLNFLVPQAHRTSDGWRVWRKPRNEPLVDVDGAVFIAIHYQATVRTTIHSLPERHVLLALTDMAHPGGIAFIDHVQVFPKAHAFVR